MLAIFVAQADYPDILSAHLPRLVKAASLNNASSTEIRLVRLPRGSSVEIGRALGIPPVGLVGLLKGTIETDEMEQLLNHEVGDLKVPGVEEIANGAYLPFKIHTVEKAATVKLKAK